jgi:Icc protein
VLTFLHISDTHISGDPDYHPPWIPETVPHPNRGVEALLTAINQLPFAIDFILHTGDVCADPHEVDYYAARGIFAQFRQPVFLLPGNHDSAAHMEAILHDGQTLHVLRNARVEVCGFQLVTLDTAGDGDVHAPTLDDEQIDFFADALTAASDQPTIVAMHHSPIETGVRWLDDHMRIQNGERVQRLLRAHRKQLVGVFHGHIHQPTASLADGVLYICCPSTWSNLAGYPGLGDGVADPLTPGGFNLVMIRDGRSFVRRCNLPLLTR